MSFKLKLDVSEGTMKGLAFQESNVSHWEIRLKTVWNAKNPDPVKVLGDLKEIRIFSGKAERKQTAFPGPSPSAAAILPEVCVIPWRTLFHVHISVLSVQISLHNLVVSAWSIKGFETHAQVRLCFLKWMRSRSDSYCLCLVLMKSTQAMSVLFLTPVGQRLQPGSRATMPPLWECSWLSSQTKATITGGWYSLYLLCLWLGKLCLIAKVPVEGRGNKGLVFNEPAFVRWKVLWESTVAVYRSVIGFCTLNS